MDLSEREIVLEEINQSSLKPIVCKLNTYEVSVEEVKKIKTKNKKHGDTRRGVTFGTIEARAIIFYPWHKIDKEDTVSKVFIYFDDGRTKSDPKLKKEVDEHLRRELGSDKPFSFCPRNSKDEEGVQLADVLAHSYQKYVEENADAAFDKIRGKTAKYAVKYLSDSITFSDTETDKQISGCALLTK